MIKIEFVTSYDNKGLKALQKDIAEAKGALAGFQAEAQALCEGMSDSCCLASLAEDFQDAVTSTLGETNWDGLWGPARKTLSDSLGGAVVDGFKHGFDNAGALWETAFAKLARIGDAALSKMLSGVFEKLVDGLGSLAWDDLLEPVGSFLGLDQGLGGLLDNVTSTISSVGGAIGSWLGLDGGLSGLVDGASSLFSSGGGASLGGLVDAGGYFAGGLSEFATSGLADLGGYFGLGGASEFAAEGATLGGGEAAGLSSLFSGGASSLLSVGGPVAATILGADLFANAMGMQGPITAVMGALQGGGGHTQESALAYIIGDMEHLAASTERVQNCLESAVDGVQGFGGSMLLEMAPATQEMTILADTAGLGQENLNAMIDALGPMQGKWIEASEVMATASGAIDRMSETLSLNNEFLVGCSSQTGAFSDLLLNLAANLELPAGAASALQATIGGLVSQWELGSFSVEDLSFRLKQAFAGALAEAANQADMTSDRMRALEESIRSIPTDWQTYISVVYEEQNKPSTLHTGGRVMHSGGWLANLPRFHSGAQVTNLAQDEVPIIARRGEYVVRAESVTAASLPWLAALNQSGKVASPNQASPQVNLHLEVHGNILGNESGLESLARTLERKLREIQGGRFGFALG